MKQKTRIIKVRHTDGNDYAKTVTVPHFESVAEALQVFLYEDDLLRLVNEAHERATLRRERDTLVWDLRHTDNK